MVGSRGKQTAKVTWLCRKSAKEWENPLGIDSKAEKLLNRQLTEAVHLEVADRDTE